MVERRRRSHELERLQHSLVLDAAILNIHGYTVAAGGDIARASIFEAGYATSVSEAEVELGVTFIYSNEDLVGESDEALIFTVGKSFDL